MSIYALPLSSSRARAVGGVGFGQLQRVVKNPVEPTRVMIRMRRGFASCRPPLRILRIPAVLAARLRSTAGLTAADLGPGQP